MNQSDLPVRLPEAARRSWQSHVDRWFDAGGDVPKLLEEALSGHARRPALKSLQQEWSRFRGGDGRTIAAWFKGRRAEIAKLSGVSVEQMESVLSELLGWRKAADHGPTLSPLIPRLRGRDLLKGGAAHPDLARAVGPARIAWRLEGARAPDAAEAALDDWIVNRRKHPTELAFDWDLVGADDVVLAPLRARLESAGLRHDTVSASGDAPFGVGLVLEVCALNVEDVERWVAENLAAGALALEGADRVRAGLIRPWKLDGAILPAPLLLPAPMVAIVAQIVAGEVDVVDARLAQRAWTLRRMGQGCERVLDPAIRVAVERWWPQWARDWLEKGGAQLAMVPDEVASWMERRIPCTLALPGANQRARIRAVLACPDPGAGRALLDEIGWPFGGIEVRDALIAARVLVAEHGLLRPADPDLTIDLAARALVPEDIAAVAAHPDGRRALTLAVLDAADVDAWMKAALAQRGWLRGVATRCVIAGMTMRSADGDPELVVRTWATALWYLLHAVEDVYGPPREGIVYADERWSVQASLALRARLPLLAGPDPHASLAALVDPSALADAREWGTVPDFLEAVPESPAEGRRHWLASTGGRLKGLPDADAAWRLLWQFAPWQMPVWTHGRWVRGLWQDQGADLLLFQARSGDRALQRALVEAPGGHGNGIGSWILGARPTLRERVGWVIDLGCDEELRTRFARAVLRAWHAGDRDVPVSAFADLTATLTPSHRSWLLFDMAEGHRWRMGWSGVQDDAMSEVWEILGDAPDGPLDEVQFPPAFAVTVADAGADLAVLRAWCGAPRRAALRAEFVLPCGVTESVGREQFDRLWADAWELRHLALLALAARGESAPPRASVLGGPGMVSTARFGWWKAVHACLHDLVRVNTAAPVGYPRSSPQPSQVTDEAWHALRDLLTADRAAGGECYVANLAAAFRLSEAGVSALLDFAGVHAGLRDAVIASLAQALWDRRDGGAVQALFARLPLVIRFDEVVAREPVASYWQRLDHLVGERDPETVAWLLAARGVGLVGDDPVRALRRGFLLAGGATLCADVEARVEGALRGRAAFSPWRRPGEFVFELAARPVWADALWDDLDDEQRVGVLSGRSRLDGSVWLERARAHLAPRAFLWFAERVGDVRACHDAWARVLAETPDAAARLRLGFRAHRPWTAFDAVDLREVVGRIERQAAFDEDAWEALCEPLEALTACARGGDAEGLPGEELDGLLVRAWPQLRGWLAETEAGQQIWQHWSLYAIFDRLRAAAAGGGIDASELPGREYLFDDRSDLAQWTDQRLLAVASGRESDDAVPAWRALDELERRVDGEAFASMVRKELDKVPPLDLISNELYNALWVRVARLRPQVALAWATSLGGRFPKQRRSLGAWLVRVGEVPSSGSVDAAEMRAVGLKWLQAGQV